MVSKFEKSLLIINLRYINLSNCFGVVTRLQREFVCEGLSKPQYIRCQNGVLDLILYHLLDYCRPVALIKPKMNYDFVNGVLIEYKNLHTDYDGLEIAPAGTEQLAWRNDYKFLFELCKT